MIDSTLLIKGNGGKRTAIRVAEIEYVRGSGNYAFIHLVDKNPIVVALTLQRLAERLPGFVRIHKQSLVNPMHITGHNLTPGRDSLISLAGDRTLAVSRRRASLIRKQLSK